MSVEDLPAEVRMAYDYADPFMTVAERQAMDQQRATAPPLVKTTTPPMTRINETMFQTKGKASFDLLLRKGQDAERRVADALNLPQGKFEVKYVDVGLWDRANFSVELEQYYHSDGLWRDSGIRVAVADGVEYFVVVYGDTIVFARVSDISDIAEAAMAGKWEDHGCWYYERWKDKTTQQVVDVPTRIVNIRLDWFLLQRQFRAREGEWQWRLTST